jgi:hypothetical protein
VTLIFNTPPESSDTTRKSTDGGARVSPSMTDDESEHAMRPTTAPTDRKANNAGFMRISD